MKKNSGFSLIELLIVMAIISSLSLIMFFNFRSASTNATARHQESSSFISLLRNAQHRALSGSNFQNISVCGYGIHQETTTSYLIYAGKPSGNDCVVANKNYQSSDYEVQIVKLANQNMLLSGPSGSFRDIFFEMPDPKVYINNSYDITSSTQIYIYKIGTVCPGTNCTVITIYGSGRIDVSN